MNPFVEIVFIAICTSASCALLGNFIVLRGQSMMTDAISHTVLLGIVLAYILAETLDSPLLIIGASLMGLITVWTAETIMKKKYMTPDSTIGLLFPFFFSLAVILITHETGNVHLDTDSVLLGELAFAPFHRLYIGSVDIGAYPLYTSLAILALNSLMLILFYKEITIATFDSVTAKLMGFSPKVLHYGLMTLVSITAVVAFQSIGSILVIAFMIAPSMISALWVKTLRARIFLSILFGALSAILGTLTAIYLDVSLAGMMSTCLGIFFLLSLLKYRVLNYQ